MPAAIPVGPQVWGNGGEEADGERGAAGHGDGVVGGGQGEFVGCRWACLIPVSTLTLERACLGLWALARLSAERTHDIGTNGVVFMAYHGLRRCVTLDRVQLACWIDWYILRLLYRDSTDRRMFSQQGWAQDAA